jgi:hypothetical protein
VANAFHKAAIAKKYVGAMINEVVAGFIEFGCKKPLGQGHAHGIGDALTQWPCCGLNTGGHSDFRVSRCFGMKLTKVLQFLHWKVVAGEVQKRVNKHGPVAIA